MNESLDLVFWFYFGFCLFGVLCLFVFWMVFWVVLCLGFFFFMEPICRLQKKKSGGSGNFVVPDFLEMRVLKHFWTCSLQACSHRAVFHNDLNGLCSPSLVTSLGLLSLS